MAKITAILHRAYRPLADAGMNFVAATQSADVTDRRVTSATAAFFAHVEAEIIGPILYYNSSPTANLPKWYDRDDVGIFAQFAVEPQFQRSGVGKLLLGRVERVAIDHGKAGLACDTAVPATHLRQYYARLGFREIDRHRWNHATYESVVLSKTLLRRMQQ